MTQQKKKQPDLTQILIACLTLALVAVVALACLYIQKNSQYDTLAKLDKATSSMLQSTTDELTKTQIALDDMISKQELTDLTLSTTKTRLINTESELAEEQQKQAQTSAALEEMTAKQEETAAALAAKETELADKAAVLAETEKVLAAKEAALAESEKTLATLTTTQEETAAALAAKETELADKAAALAESEKALSAKAADLAETEKVLATKEAALAEAEKTLAALTAKQEETTAALAKAEKALTDLTAEQGKTTAALTDTKKALADLTAEHEKTTTALIAKEAALTEAQLALAAAQEENEKLQAAWDEIPPSAAAAIAAFNGENAVTYTLDWETADTHEMLFLVENETGAARKVTATVTFMDETGRTVDTCVMEQAVCGYGEQAFLTCSTAAQFTSYSFDIEFEDTDMKSYYGTTYVTAAIQDDVAVIDASTAGTNEPDAIEFLCLFRDKNNNILHAERGKFDAPAPATTATTEIPCPEGAVDVQIYYSAYGK